MLLKELIESRNLDIILASGSPRRRELMEGAGIPFRVAERYSVNESSYPARTPAAEVPAYVARAKSEGYPHALQPNQILVTADTIVIHKNKPLGKPQDIDSAVKMLRTLSGSEHEVVTAVSLRRHCPRKEDKTLNMSEFSELSKVTFRSLTAEEIEHYIYEYKPFDKAGSYGIQEWIGLVGITRIEGSYYNVMGLPVDRLYSALGEFITQV